MLAERASLFDYELITGENGKRLLAFGKFAGRAGLIDFLGGLGQRMCYVLLVYFNSIIWESSKNFELILLSGFLSLGYSTPFLSLGTSYMYSSLAAAKAAVISVGEEIATMGLPSTICPLVFVFTGTGNGT